MEKLVCVLACTLALALAVNAFHPHYRFCHSGGISANSKRIGHNANDVHIRTPSVRSSASSLLMGALEDSPLELCEENAAIVIEEVKAELGTIFGYDQGSRDVGITGEIELIEIDGPTITVALSGRFWHATDTVMLRVGSFIKQRIPEVLEVTLDIDKSRIVDDNRLNTEGSGERRLF